MSQSSFYGYVSRMQAGSFSTAEPVSASRAFRLRSNLLHLMDSFCQHRINWCGAIASGDGSNGTVVGSTLLGAFDTPNVLYEQEFMHTWLGFNHPANLDLLIRTAIHVASGSPEMDVRVRVVPNSHPVGDVSGDAIVDETHTVTSLTGSWSHQAFLVGSDDRTMGLLRSAELPRAFSVNEDDVWVYPWVAMLRLQVVLTNVDGTSPTQYITGVSVREFP